MAAHRTLPRRLPRGPAAELSRDDRQWRYEYQRRRRLPDMIEATRIKLRHLEAEALRYEMHELVGVGNG